MTSPDEPGPLADYRKHRCGTGVPLVMDGYAELIDVRTADARGRVALGPEYGGKRLRVAVLETVADGDV